jgi:hypothetical protein
MLQSRVSSPTPRIVNEKGLAELLILSLLQDRARHGYESAKPSTRTRRHAPRWRDVAVSAAVPPGGSGLIEGDVTTRLNVVMTPRPIRGPAVPCARLISLAVITRD